jgi:hypothetical protein
MLIIPIQYFVNITLLLFFNYCEQSYTNSLLLARLHPTLSCCSTNDQEESNSQTEERKEDSNGRRRWRCWDTVSAAPGCQGRKPGNRSRLDAGCGYFQSSTDERGRPGGLARGCNTRTQGYRAVHGFCYCTGNAVMQVRRLLLLKCTGFRHTQLLRVRLAAVSKLMAGLRLLRARVAPNKRGSA